MTTTTIEPRSTTGRITYATLASLLVAATAAEAIMHSSYWPIAAFGIGPDLALLYGGGTDLARGQIHPRAVGAYNLLHRFWGPLALGGAVTFGIAPVAFLVGALAWGFHVALDRALGYGLRTRDGFQRP
jgi:hypothetical protein